MRTHLIRLMFAAALLISFAATEFGGPVAGWNLADHAEHWKAKRGSCAA